MNAVLVPRVITAEVVQTPRAHLNVTVPAQGTWSQHARTVSPRFQSFVSFFLSVF